MTTHTVSASSERVLAARQMTWILIFVEESSPQAVFKVQYSSGETPDHASLLHLPGCYTNRRYKNSYLMLWTICLMRFHCTKA